jgi:ketosteroid isomerase-like protein
VKGRLVTVPAGACHEILGPVMSAENVDVVRQGLVRFSESGEFDWELVHEDVEIHDHDVLDARDYRGPSGFVRWVRDWASAWADFSFEPEELIDAGDRVVVVARLKATGRSSGVELERRDGMVFELREGLVVRVDYFNSRRQALEAVGLGEPG